MTVRITHFRLSKRRSLCTISRLAQYHFSYLPTSLTFEKDKQ